MAPDTDHVISIQGTAADKSPELNAVDIASLLKAAQSNENGNLDGLVITQDIFKKIKAGLIAAVESMEKNPSLISRAADFWSPLPLWQKIVGGVAITLPTLILGIVANINFLLVMCCITTLAYTGLAIALDDHHKNKISVMDSLIKGISGLADLLELTITALDVIRQKLAVQVETFAAENHHD